MVEAGCVAKAYGVRGGEQPEAGVRADDAVLVEQGEPAFDFEDALDDEHDVGPAGVIFVEHQRAGMLQRPGQYALAEFGDLLAVLEDDGVLADEVDAADVAVQVDAQTGPVEAGGDLLDVCALAGAVVALDHDAAVMREAGKDGERGFAVEAVGGVDIGHVLGAVAEGGDRQVCIDLEQLARGYGGVGQHGRVERFGLGDDLVHQAAGPSCGRKAFFFEKKKQKAVDCGFRRRRPPIPI